ncbi:MAG: hydroxyethylthiazole kinase, partial [Anaerovoracaceae bacterium]
RKSKELGHPTLLDPVGVGASALRTNTAIELMKEIDFDVIRGNISEIKTLAEGSGTTKGVDADVADQITEDNLEQGISFAKKFSQKTGGVVAITGAIDIVAKGEKAYIIRNGNPMMSKITGTGCMLSGMITAYLVANPETPLEATAAAVCAMGLCGELGFARLTKADGNSTYRNYIIDAVCNLTGEELERGANYEVR